MRFRDGMWLTAADKTIQYAEDIYSINQSGDERSLELLCPTKRIRSRGDTLNCPTVTIKLEAVIDGVISVEATHWAGQRRLGPDFELFPDGKPESAASITTGEKGTALTSGGLTATVSPDPHEFEIRFSGHDGREVTSLLNRSVGFAYTPATGNMKVVEDMRKTQHYMFTQTELGVGESVHGLGERFGAFNKVGQHVEVWNEDGGTSSDQAYKNISFWLSSRGYGVFIDTPEHIDLEIGSERSCRVQTAVESQRLKWYLIYGPTPKEVLTKYTILTGKSGKVPAWSFGLWLTTSFTTNYDEATVTDWLSQMQTRKIPLEVFHYDCFWLRAFHWCDFVFSKDHFPDPKGSMTRLKSSKLANKVCVWINPYLGQASPVFAEAAEKGYLVKRLNGDVWQWDLWQAGMALVDFTNPAARKWYVSCLEQLFDTGVDCLKTDFGERIPSADVQWHDPTVDPKKMHNYYSFMFNQLAYEALQNRFGADQAVLFARSATAGTQRFPLCWGGDCESTAPALAESIRGGLSIGLSGFSFWSCDIGGFEGNPAPWIYKRWVAFGLFCSHSRLHGSNSYRVPWLIDGDSQEPENATDVVRHFVRVKRRLMPYLFAEAKEAAENGWPMSLRAMGLEFPEDQTAWFCDRQFMVGKSLLVAPVFTEEGDVEFYLPEGKWTSWWDGHVEVGPKWVKEKHGFLTLPVYVRERSVLVLGSEDEAEKGEGFGYDWVKQGAEVKLYHTQAGDSFTVVDREGKDVVTLEVGAGNTVSGLDKIEGTWSSTVAVR
ncbi:hypothetical protein P152DRAFT_474296 [Eremomyces bilateralis CBS 781.70]|uniref:alpha-D-xyloside xylohydrolase n=1 Tax=Eremomyces bilateralis CBS 781.70 TaxID=1392243 RepID=A0A6G1G224_9PEZI|nr:uncharacterized protein P152DRAFT_474296 [Eremomyces bilateralis CBS 781.70]KAF1812068.1 hypothetical protein P152DRAFT_474296 [Eremomyces bilateralis CBS 781.70]